MYIYTRLPSEVQTQASGLGMVTPEPPPFMQRIPTWVFVGLGAAVLGYVGYRHMQKNPLPPFPSIGPWPPPWLGPVFWLGGGA